MTAAISTRYLAIRTGNYFTLVTVDLVGNQCIVDTCPRVRKRYPSAATRIFHNGIGERSIRNAAMDGAGESFRTLKALRASVEPEIAAEIERAREYDC